MVQTRNTLEVRDPSLQLTTFRVNLHVSRPLRPRKSMHGLFGQVIKGGQIPKNIEYPENKNSCCLIGFEIGDSDLYISWYTAYNPTCTLSTNFESPHKFSIPTF